MKRLFQIGQTLQTSGSDEALIAAADLIVTDAKRLVPIRTGRLKASIDRTSPRPAKRAHERTIAVGVRRPASRYAHFVEFGTVNHSAQPYLRPALDSNRMRAVGLMASVMNRFMGRTGGAATKTKLNINLGDQ
jgi:HK97 gp10 family phage protein